MAREEKLQRVRRPVHQAQLGLECGDATRSLGPIEITLKSLQLECLLGQVLEIGGLLVGHQPVAARVVGRFHNALPPLSHRIKLNASDATTFREGGAVNTWAAFDTVASGMMDENSSWI